MAATTIVTKNNSKQHSEQEEIDNVTGKTKIKEEVENKKKRNKKKTKLTDTDIMNNFMKSLQH